MKTLGLFAAGVVLVALAMLAYQKYGDWQDAKVVQWRADSTRVANATREAERAAAVAHVVYDTTRLRYVEYRDRVVASGKATPAQLETFKRCDALVVTCAQQRTADSIVIARKDAELAIARARPTERPKRVILYGEGMYDVLHAAPVFRAGAELRLLGGISAAAAADLAIPPMGDSRVTTRALLGIRYTF